MAQVTRVELLDDLEGGPADETVRFGVDGKSYVIDLKSENVELFRAAVADFVAAARRDTTGGVRVARRAASTDEMKARNQAIREWARENGYAVADRGRISVEITHAYEQNH
ncbi:MULTISPECIES: Lsr2 family protein [unclassified Pseudonocardia]|uniref:histone-like nucleoid-structuring protein Lsr2 n=1 Tax=unclassified Pseudonocardia TaxID=2619320 RepID=UPI001CF6C210|nr:MULTISPECIES: Lsr2 family protein [unclassified Pseudonocardia]